MLISILWLASMTYSATRRQFPPPRLNNDSASTTAPLPCPAEVPQGPPSPLTRTEFLELSGKFFPLVDSDFINILLRSANQCQAVSALLELPELSADVTLEERLQQIFEYIGIPY